MDSLKIGIVGGSLGGLFAGHALRKAGFEAHIFERSTGEANTRGAGIVFQPDLAEYLRDNDIAVPENISTFCRSRKFYRQDGSLESSNSAHQRFVSWEALYKSLRKATPNDVFHEGFALKSFEEINDKVVLHFENGEKRQVDLLVAADGVKSHTRLKLLGGRKPSYSGYVGWRGVIEERDVPPDMLERLDETFSFCHIPSSHFLTYFIPGEGNAIAKGKRRLNWVWYKNVEEGETLDYYMTDKNGVVHDFSMPEGMLRPELKTSFYKMAERELPPLFSRIALLTRDPFLQPILDMKVERMVYGRTVLIGDAAFIVRPHTAASTYKAAMDGIHLAKALSEESDLRTALAGWEAGEMRIGNHLLISGQASGNQSQFPERFAARS